MSEVGCESLHGTKVPYSAISKAFTVALCKDEWTYDWHNSQWTVPINLSVSQLIKRGKMPFSLGLGVKCFAGNSGGRAGLGVRFVVTPIFPTGKK